MGMKSLEQYRADFIDVIKRTMATNLTNKGTSASPTESLQALSDKIANVNTGKKWASGTLTSVSASGTSNVTGLGFIPSIIILTFNGSSGDTITIYPTVSGLLETNGITKTWAYPIWNSGNVNALVVLNQPSNSTFTIKNQSTSTMYHVAWIAFE